ncbi:hypothetical protein Tco_0749486 [Tanacetum coccineum]|uniref:Uncharacterized protein n=1 Tax=Tanacetum coccineum TaxID=301880 RepID=A0ABQ4Z1E2_9ASTR
MMMAAAAVVGGVKVAAGEVEARGGEWIWGSGDENRFWFRSEKSAGKLFRRRWRGGRRLAGNGEGERRGSEEDDV